MISEKPPVEQSEQDVMLIRLRDGRKLAYREFGVPDGKPVLYFHGHPGSRLDMTMFQEHELTEYGLRFIAPDRPGIGLSDFLPGRRMVDWPADVSDLADALGIEQFAVMGVSGGGPFAAVTAHALPDRVTKLVMVCSVGRFDSPGATQGMGPGLMYFRLARYFPWLSQMQLRMMAKGLCADRQKMIAQVKLGMPPVDAGTLSQPGVMDGLLTSMAEFLRQGPRGPAVEAGLYLRPWGFPLEEIRVPAYLWHGLADQNAPIAMGRDIADRIPSCRARFVEGEGHFSLILRCTAEFMQTLAS